MSVFRAQVWNLTNCKLRASLVGHTGYINTVTVSPDGSLCASGGKARPPRSTGRHVTAQAWQHDMECAVVACLRRLCGFGRRCSFKQIMSLCGFFPSCCCVKLAAIET